MNASDYRKDDALRKQRELLQLKKERLERLINLLDANLKGEKSMKKTRKVAAVITAVAMAAVSAAPVMADEIKDLYDYEIQTREIETWNILQSQLAN